MKCQACKKTFSLVLKPYFFSCFHQICQLCSKTVKRCANKKCKRQKTKKLIPNRLAIELFKIKHKEQSKIEDVNEKIEDIKSYNDQKFKTLINNVINHKNKILIESEKIIERIDNLKHKETKILNKIKSDITNNETESILCRLEELTKLSEIELFFEPNNFGSLRINTKVEFNNGYYIGEVSNNVANGHGVMHFNDNSSCVGNFQNGLFHGRVIYYFSNGDISDGTYDNGETKAINYKWTNGVELIGNYQNNKLHGIVQYLFNNNCFKSEYFIEGNLQATVFYT